MDENIKSQMPEAETGQAPDDSTLAEHLRKLEESLLQPEVRFTPGELDILLAEDFVEYGSSGRIWHKEDCLVPGGIGVRKLRLTHFECRRLGADTALNVFQILDEDTGRASLRSSVWQQRQGRWRLVFHQGTPIPET